MWSMLNTADLRCGSVLVSNPVIAKHFCTAKLQHLSHYFQLWFCFIHCILIHSHVMNCL